MDAMEALNSLEDEIRDRKSLFARKDNSRALSLISELKESLPGTMEEANYIIAKQQQILKNADIVAKNTLKAAEERAQHLASTTDVMRKADGEAKRILDKASAKCDLLVKKTKEHLDAMFIETEQFLLSTLNMIRTNREELREALLIKSKEQ